ncbi:uncharacterized protein [Epargyreus clarus]|uniref:uncharacterized protein n=1 Tax=Epargyreus clarus TaxID=520877 RepID=UPI003C308804
MSRSFKDLEELHETSVLKSPMTIWSEKKISRNFGIIRVPDCVRANFKGTIEERQTRLCTTIFEPLNCKSEESYFSNFVFQFNEKPVPSTPIPAKEPPKNKDTSIYTYIGVGISLFVLVVIVQGVLIFTYKRRASATVQKLLGVINNEVESSIAMRPKMLLPHELEPIQEVRRVKVTKITSTTSRQFAKSHNDVQHPSKPYNSRIPVHSLPTTGRLLPQTPEAHNFRGNVPTKPYQSGINNGYLDEESL